MAKILNIDAIETSAPARQIVMDGVAHDIVEMTVDNFLVSTREAEEILKAKGGYPEQIEASIRMIRRSVPTLTEETLRKHRLETLGKIGAFVRGEDVEEAQETEEKAGNEQTQASKESTSDSSGAGSPTSTH